MSQLIHANDVKGLVQAKEQKLRQEILENTELFQRLADQIIDSTILSKPRCTIYVPQTWRDIHYKVWADMLKERGFSVVDQNTVNNYVTVSVTAAPNPS